VESLRQKLAEVPRLRRELADARAALGELEEALAWDTHRVADRYTLGRPDGGDKEFSNELKGAWERVSLLQKRYSDLQVRLSPSLPWSVST
jgi:hypothetical protein